MGDKIEFSKFIRALCLFFERKNPSPETLDQWWEEMKDIDPVFYPSLNSYLHDLPVWPKNLPYQVRQIINQIRPQTQDKDHPAHYYPWKYADKDCIKCVGEGFTREKAVAYNKAHTKSMNLSARVICSCVEKRMFTF